MFEISRGEPIVGCKLIEQKGYFGIYSDIAVNMVLKIYAHVYEEMPLVEVILNRSDYTTGDLFHIAIEDIKEGYSYTWQVQDKEGRLSGPLIDPYTRGVKAFPKGSNHYKNVVVKDQLYEGKKPCIPWEDTLIYEMHVGAFTKSSSSGIEEKYRGTYDGILKQLPYLKSLGITAVELLPIFKWNKHTLLSKHPITQETLQDVWGYNSIAFFSLQEEYCSSGSVLEEIRCFRNFVRKMHEAGIEVLLDVVYNHTGEGGEGGAVFNFKALSPKTYYKFKNNQYRNDAGTGNTFNNTKLVTKQLVLDSLRYWVIHMGVDGFRFDLASILTQNEQGNWIEGSLLEDIVSDPILSHVKLIAECWDAKGAYDVGRMPYAFSEWSDHFRDTIRRFVRGDQGMTGELSKSLMGREIVFADNRKGVCHTIHFVTAHDGFTLRDLVSYQSKHNELNGEQNRDGSNNNYSNNCGIEGETEDQIVLKLRRKRMKFFMSLLLVSQGVPMLLMGDEIGRTQKGNNNAFCQDNEMVWMDWHLTSKNQDHLQFTTSMIAFRKQSLCFKKAFKDQVRWAWHGIHYGKPDWSYYSCSLAWEMEVPGERLYMAANSYTEPLKFDLPPTSKKWYLVMDTAKENNLVRKEVKEGIYEVEAYSLCIFKEI